MLKLAVMFLLVGVVLSALGFGGVGGAFVGVAKVLAIIAIVAFVIFLILGLVAGKTVKNAID